MADQSQGSTQTSEHTEQTGQSGQQYPSSEHQDQSWINSQFAQQMGGGQGLSTPPAGIDMTSQVVAAYFDSLEAQRRQFDEQMRATRRVTDQWAQSLILQQTTSQVAHAVAPVVFGQVISYLRSNPSLIKSLVQQSTS